MNSAWSIYCLNFNNVSRNTSMTNRFHNLGITNFTMSSGVPLSDPRINSTNIDNVKRCHSCMFGHLDMIRDFLENDSSPYGIFCEDDILMDSNFVFRLDHIIRDFEKQNLDILLLGYLYPSVIVGDNSHNYYEYAPESIWGTQMYMLSRKWARQIIDKYGCADASTTFSPFSADWTITQHGNRRIIYPMLAIEDGTSKYEDAGQAQFHALSHSAHLDSSKYI